jgi:SAM-dependent methyltransferase
LRPERVLDVGCGTGKVARGLIARGLSVLGVERTYSADEWVALIATYSAHHALEPARLAELQRELHAAIAAHGGTVLARGNTLVSRSRARPR